MNSLKRIRTWIFIVIGLMVLPLAVMAIEEAHPVFLLKLSGTIDPAMARYVTRGLAEARESQASAVVIQLETPGGLDGSMRQIVQAILNSPVPIIVYVAPSGARAASAGAFIALSAHVAAMAPGTHIGVDAKFTNDAIAYIRSIAELRARNQEWVESSVRDSISSSAEEAHEKKVIDVVAHDLDDLLTQLEGKQVKTVFGSVILQMSQWPRRDLPASALEQTLHQLAHPNFAYLLLLIGIYGLVFELSTPGATFPGVLGAICLVLALVAMETLDVNWAGLALIFLAVIFFIADIKLPGYGALTIAGVIAFLLGSGMLFSETRVPHLHLPWATIASATAATTGFFIFIIGAGIRALQRKVASGIEGLIGAEGMAKTDLKPDGFVNVKGEEWQAHSFHSIRKGAKIRVVKFEGLTLHVEPFKEG